MSDKSVRQALRSDAPLVVVESPAGCGKTHQGAQYAREIGEDPDGSGLLVLTHTHAARSVFEDRTRACGHRVEIRTIDGLITEIAAAYHSGLDLPAEPGRWARRRKNGHAEVAVRVRRLLDRYPMIGRSLARRYSAVVCDEHQDSSGDQHAIVMALYRQGAKVRIFADPMQRIFRETRVSGARPRWEWSDLLRAGAREERLDQPHRWSDGCAELGAWTLDARRRLEAGEPLDLSGELPRSVSVLCAENEAPSRKGYRLASGKRREVEDFLNEANSVMVLARHNVTTVGFRAFFGRRLPLWEGHTRSSLEKLVDSSVAGRGDPGQLAEAVVAFMGAVGAGFSPTDFGNILIDEARKGCNRRRRRKPAKIQELARFLVAEPDHRGVAKVLRQISELRESDSDFQGIHVDGRREFLEAARLDAFDDCEEGLLEITRRRTHAPQRIPEKAISTIHKAKGVETDAVCLINCDGKSFPDSRDARCVLYVALSRAISGLKLIVSEQNPSPLLRL